MGPKRVTRKVTAVRHFWSMEEDKAILEYARTCYLSGHEFEKPTAPEFYRQYMSKESPPTLMEIPVDKIVQHMKSLRSQYIAAKEWRNKTGEGILVSGEANAEKTVQDALLKKCKYFNEFDELLGTKPQYDPPYVFDTSGVAWEEPFAPIFDSEGEQLHAQYGDRGYHSQDGSSAEICDQPRSKKLKKSPIKSAASALEAAMKARSIVDEKRLDWEKVVKEDENQLKREQLKADEGLKLKQLEFDKKKWADELEQQKLQGDRAYELAKLKIEKETEIQKYKIDKEFGLERNK